MSFGIEIGDTVSNLVATIYDITKKKKLQLKCIELEIIGIDRVTDVGMYGLESTYTLDKFEKHLKGSKDKKIKYKLKLIKNVFDDFDIDFIYDDNATPTLFIKNIIGKRKKTETLGSLVSDLSNCIYKTIKKNKSKIELIDVLTNNHMVIDRDEWPIFFNNTPTLDAIEDIFLDDEKLPELDRKIFQFNVVDPIFDGILQLGYKEGTDGYFTTTIYLGSKIDNSKCEIFDINDKDILSRAKVGDLVVDKKNIKNKQRGMASKVVIMKNGKLAMQKAFDDSGYTDIPISVTRFIKNPQTFYSSVPDFLKEDWGIRGLNLDKVVHADLIKTLKNVSYEENGDGWYPL